MPAPIITTEPRQTPSYRRPAVNFGPRMRRPYGISAPKSEAFLLVFAFLDLEGAAGIQAIWPASFAHPFFL